MSRSPSQEKTREFPKPRLRDKSPKTRPTKRVSPIAQSRKPYFARLCDCVIAYPLASTTMAMAMAAAVAVAVIRPEHAEKV